MSYITSIKYFKSNNPAAKQILLLCGYGGKIWQTKRLINLLNKNGYNVRAIDYPTTIFTKGDPQMLIDLVNEVHTEAIRLQNEVREPILLLGISLGALISLNILRRDRRFTKAVMITGGDIVKVAHRAIGRKIWPQTYDELAKIWESVNMYSNPAALKHASVLMVLPTKDGLIDPDDVRKEILKQQRVDNKFQLIERNIFGHIPTIFIETVLFPKRILDYIKMVTFSLSR